MKKLFFTDSAIFISVDFVQQQKKLLFRAPLANAEQRVFKLILQISFLKLQNGVASSFS